MKAGWEGDSIFVVSDRLMADKRAKSRLSKLLPRPYGTDMDRLSKNLDSNLLKNLHEGLRSPIDERNSVPDPIGFFFQFWLALAQVQKALAGLSKLIPIW